MKNPVNKVATFVAVSAAAAGIGIGALSVAGASTTPTTPTSAAAPAPSSAQPNPVTMAHGPGETLLTGSDLATATAAVNAVLPSGASIIRIESNSQGSYPYEAHVTLADGSNETVELSSSFQVITTITGFGAGPAGGPGFGHPDGPNGGPDLDPQSGSSSATSGASFH